MNYDVQITEEADADLRGIFEHIAYKLRSLTNATGQLDRLEAAIYSLDQMPERYALYQKEPWHSRGLRKLPVDNYLVFYVPIKETNTVHIVRVLYGGQDVEAQLNEHTNI